MGGKTKVQILQIIYSILKLCSLSNFDCYVLQKNLKPSKNQRKMPLMKRKMVKGSQMERDRLMK